MASELIVSWLNVGTSGGQRGENGCQWTHSLFGRRVQHAVVLQLAEELDAKQAVQRHEEQEEQRHVVNLLTRSPAEWRE